MVNANLELICKYNSTAYEQAFDIIKKLIIDKNKSKFPFGKRGNDKAIVLGAKILQRYFEDIEQSSGSEVF